MTHFFYNKQVLMEKCVISRPFFLHCFEVDYLFDFTRYRGIDDIEPHLCIPCNREVLFVALDLPDRFLK